MSKSLISFLRKPLFLWRWHRSFWRDFGAKKYWENVVVLAWKYRFKQAPLRATCLLRGHLWRKYTENVAPDVVSGPTGGWDECDRCHHAKDQWGYV